MRSPARRGGPAELAARRPPARGSHRIAAAKRGARAHRAERAAQRAADPQNLIWVMPAEVCACKVETIIVVAGGQPSAGRRARPLPAGRDRDRRRRRRRPGARARAPRRPRDRRLRLGHARQGSRPPRRPARAIERHPAAKDATDLELALDAAIALEPARIVVVGDGGGRLDHLLGSCSLLGLDRYAGAADRRRTSAAPASTSSAARGR